MKAITNSVSSTCDKYPRRLRFFSRAFSDPVFRAIAGTSTLLIVNQPLLREKDNPGHNQDDQEQTHTDRRRVTKIVKEEAGAIEIHNKRRRAVARPTGSKDKWLHEYLERSDDCHRRPKEDRRRNHGHLDPKKLLDSARAVNSSCFEHTLWNRLQSTHKHHEIIPEALPQRHQHHNCHSVRRRSEEVGSMNPEPVSYTHLTLPTIYSV